MFRPLALACLLAATPAMAAISTDFGVKQDLNAPIAITAKTLTGDLESNTLSYSQDVVVVQGDMRMRSDTLHVHAVDQKPDRITVNGHVFITSPSGTAQGDNGIYNVARHVITLNGNVVLTKEKNVMRGATLTVNLVTGIAELGGGGGRVQGLFTPETKADQK